MAALAGVSAATVSRVMNNVPTVDPELATRVQAAAAKLEYRSNGVARSLRRRRTDVWALIISDISNPFFTSVARGVEDVAQREGFSVVLCNSDEDPVKEARYLDVAEREQVAGIIMSPNMTHSDISRLSIAGIPVVTIDRSLRPAVDSVLVASVEGARAATGHLFDEGWTRPACVTGPATAETAEQRLRGYREAFVERRRRPARSLVRHADFHAETGRTAVSSLLDSRHPPDAFFVANSSMALGALEEFARRGLTPGRDVGLITFDDAPWVRFVNPPMSAIAQPTYDIGHLAGELLLERISGRRGGEEPKRLVLPTELIVRASSLRSSSGLGTSSVR